ncbi:MAG: UDP-3-O-(3-hydroxymyristoyl)glucosamine N-acyltransferase [Selenomonadaceae bacterium]|nr:UDP-3-O-(3-hydroxymyristoyl)glucosamine N-acyltransferase [Selenomonadaceae bacterium]
MKKTLQELADYVGGRVVGDGEILIYGLNNIEGAADGELTFAVEPYIEKARATEATAVMLPESVLEFPKPAIHVADPRAAFAKLMTLFTPALQFPSGVSDKAHIGQDVTLGKNVTVMPFAVVDDHATIGDNVLIYPHVYVGQYAEIGDGTVLYPSVTVREHCVVGKNCILNSSAVIGADGFGFTTKDGVHTKVPQVGNVILEDDVEIGAHVGIDRAAMGSTVIGRGTKIDNLVHIGHNCRIGANCLIVAQTGISGSTTVGHNVTFGGQVGTVGHITIGANSVYAARSGITKDMPEGYFGAGFPLQTHAEWLRLQANILALPEMRKKLSALEKKLAKYEKQD